MERSRLAVTRVLLVFVLCAALPGMLAGSVAAAEPTGPCAGITLQELQSPPAAGPGVLRIQECLACARASSPEACGFRSVAPAVARPTSSPATPKPPPPGQNANPCAGFTPADLRKSGSLTSGSRLIQCQMRCMPIAGGKQPTDAELLECIEGPTKASLTAAFTHTPENPKPGDDVVFKDASKLAGSGRLGQTWHVDGAQTATGPSFTWRQPDASPHKVKLVVTSDQGIRSEVEKTIQPVAAAGKPLCEQAFEKFPNTPRLGPSMAEGYPMQVDYDGLQKGFELAILRFEKEGGSAKLADHVGGSLGAASWLQNYGGTVDAVSRKYVFTAQSDVDKPLSQAKRGSEQALYRAMQEHATRNGKRLGPEDVLYLALQQRDGNVTEALLLAHNTLRGLARSGDSTLTGVAPNPAFIDRYLTPLRTDASPDRGTHYGDWYHLFGTAYFEAYVKSEWGAAQALGIVDGAYDEARALVSPDTYGDPSDPSSISKAANGVEQWLRSTKIGGNQAGDPQKYCVNVYGAKLGAWLYNHRIKRGSVTSTAAPAPVPPPRWDQSLQGESYLNLVYSPVSVTWEGDGQKMVLDQRTASLSGYYPVSIVPYYEEKVGTWGVAWYDAGDRAYRVTFEAVKDGGMHLVRVERGTGQVAVYAPQLRLGEKLIVDVAPGRPDPRMARPDGAPVEPTLTRIPPLAEPAETAPDLMGELDPEEEESLEDPALGGAVLLLGASTVVGLAIVVARRRPGRARSGEARSSSVPSIAPRPGMDQDAAFQPRPAEPLARFCRHCGQALPFEARFCPGCGGAVPAGPVDDPRSRLDGA